MAKYETIQQNQTYGGKVKNGAQSSSPIQNKGYIHAHEEEVLMRNLAKLTLAQERNP